MIWLLVHLQQTYQISSIKLAVWKIFLIAKMLPCVLGLLRKTGRAAAASNTSLFEKSVGKFELYI